MDNLKNTNKSFYSPIEIGSLKLNGNLFLAPIAGYSDVAFRSICVEEGATFTYTEMVSSEALVRSSKKTCLLLKKGELEKQYAVQIFGHSSNNIKEAAKIIANEVHPSCIDLNAGCPMPKITKQGAGSALLSNLPLLFEILKALVDSMMPYDIPITVKIRSGKTCDMPVWKEASKVAVEAGVKAITLHPRSQAQCYSGVSNTALIGELKNMVKDYDVKVFGSGDLFTPEDAKNMFEKTACDGVMFARGAMGNPFIFRKTKQLLETGKYEEIDIKTKIETAKKELLFLSNVKGEHVACLEMRKRIAPYIKGINNASEVRKKIVKCTTLKEYEDVLNSVCC